MLVLSRKLNEKIVIDGDIVITVVKIDRNQVRIGIEAPGHVPVYREEILPIVAAAAMDEQVAVGCLTSCMHARAGILLDNPSGDD